MKLFLAYALKDEAKASSVLTHLSEIGYDIAPIPSFIDPEAGIYLVLFSKDTKEEELLSACPWIKEQFAYSSLRGLRVMPFYVYSSLEEDVEASFEGEVGQLYENVFSGEFKPYGYDVSRSDPEIEFARVLEEYSE